MSAARAWALVSRAILVAGLALVAFVPVVFSTYFTGAVGVRALWLGLAAASLTFLAAYGGMVSLAQTALFGVAGFVTAKLTVDSGMDPWIAGLTAIGVAVAVGAVFGAIASGSEGIYFLMITLAFAVITFFFFSQHPSFGSHEGFNGVTPPTIFENPVRDPGAIYYAVLVASIMTYVGVRGLGRTAFGVALQGVRDDPVRMRALGFNVRLHRTVGFTLAAAIAAVAGVLATWHQTRISPGTIDLTRTIELLVIAVIGGLYRLEGAWIGALVFTMLDTYTRGITSRFETWIGAVFLLIVLLSPDGITGLAASIDRHVRQLLDRPSGEAPTPAGGAGGPEELGRS
jgi:branched-chain amino acid transport system permease protein